MRVETLTLPGFSSDFVFAFSKFCWINLPWCSLSSLSRSSFSRGSFFKSSFSDIFWLSWKWMKVVFENRLVFLFTNFQYDIGNIRNCDGSKIFCQTMHHMAMWTSNLIHSTNDGTVWAVKLASVSNRLQGARIKASRNDRW